MIEQTVFLTMIRTSTCQLTECRTVRSVGGGGGSRGLLTPSNSSSFPRRDLDYGAGNAFGTFCTKKATLPDWGNFERLLYFGDDVTSRVPGWTPAKGFNASER